MKTIFLGNGTPHTIKAEKFIKELDCDIVAMQNKPRRFDKYAKEYDIGFSFLYPFLVPKIEIKKTLWVNFHPAPLPKYGGRNVAYHAIMNNEIKFGGTIHYMDETFDTGNIIEVYNYIEH